VTQARVFFCEPSGRSKRWLRRYASGDAVGPCPGMQGQASFHQAMTFIDVVTGEVTSGDLWDHADPRWPKACEGCGRPFADSDNWQLFSRSLYCRADNAQEFTLEEAPVGACWDATWLHEWPAWCGPDGRSLNVKVPGGGEWCIDSRANNCTLPKDDVHKCWVRHGRPEDGTLHVDKNGVTCAAGAGSIQTRNWHGFLHNGVLSESG
jgi:hypothetical protein